MIDYKKIALVLSLQKKLCKGSEGLLTFTMKVIVDGEGKETINYSSYDGNILTGRCINIDELIEEFKELTMPQPKYKIDDVIFIIHENKLTDFKVDNVKHLDNEWHYTVSGHGYGLTWMPEIKLYPTRQALIESQIEYWEELLATEVEKVSASAMCPKCGMQRVRGMCWAQGCNYIKEKKANYGSYGEPIGE